MTYTRTFLFVLIFTALFATTARPQSRQERLAADHARLGNAAFEDGRFQEAIGHYSQALRSKPSFALYVNLGHCHTRLEHWSDAAKAYQAAIELDSESATAQIWRLLGQAHYNGAQFSQAMRALLEAASLESDDQDNIWIARCMIELEQWLQARSVLLSHLQSNPADTAALDLLAYAITQQGDWPGVIHVYRQLLAVAPDRTEYRIALANALAANGDNKQAIDTLEFAWRVDRDPSERTNRLLADLYLAEEMPAEAAACYARLIVTSEKPSADDYYRLAIAYFQAGELTSAQSAFSNMQRADPADSKPDLYLGHVAAQRGDSAAARLHYGAATEKHPAGAEAFVALANLLMENEQYGDAAAQFAAAIALGDNRPLVHYNYVLALVRQGKFEQAQAALKAALAEHPSDQNLLGLLDQCAEKAVHRKNH